MIRITEKGYKTMQEMEDFQRPLHADFATSAELKQREFSGIRINSITQEQELWTLGDLRLSMPLATMKQNPEAWDKAYEAIFKLHSVQTLNLE
jgi:hypothetical protein